MSPASSSSTSSTSPAVETRSVAKYYGRVRALQDINFAARWGEIHAVVGDNGAGKSTLVKIIAGATVPSAGDVIIDGTPQHFSHPLAALHLGIAAVYQDLALVDCRSVEANLFLGREITHRFLGVLRNRAMHEAATRTLSSLGQVNVSDSRMLVEHLSGGQRQAVAIGRSITSGARILILDEPTASLGVRESHEVLELVANLRSAARSILLVSHNLAHVFRVADRISVLRGGHLVGTLTKSSTDTETIVQLITGAKLL